MSLSLPGGVGPGEIDRGGSRCRSGLEKYSIIVLLVLLLTGGIYDYVDKSLKAIPPVSKRPRLRAAILGDSRRRPDVEPMIGKPRVG